MAELRHTVDHLLETRRCYECGRYWAIESAFVDRSRCPFCAGKAIAKALDETAAAERTARSLRGALTAAKRRRRG